jgi:multidrug efflux pump subunit AcrB
MSSLDDLRVVPVSGDRGAHVMLGDVARIDNATIVGEYDRFNGQRLITLTANVAGQDLGRTVGQVDGAIARAGAPPRGAAVAVRGQIGAMRETFTNVTAGLVARSSSSFSSSPPQLSVVAPRLSSSSRPCRRCSWAWW